MFDPLGLVIRDEQTFLTKVINLGMEQGIFTRDRADEIIRISIAMANKYVLQKEIDFRSIEELQKVQETILKLIGIGLEIKSGGNVEEAIHLLMNISPVELFRLAYTRVEKLRSAWRTLLADHKIQILVTKNEFECLSDLTCQKLANLSIFTDTEIYSIESLTLNDELFSDLTILEYYENEFERYEFIKSLKSILPFGLLNRSPNVRAEHLSDVDSIREALTNTLVISAFADAPDPVAVTMQDVRYFLSAINTNEDADGFPEEIESAMLDIIQELGENLGENEATKLTREVISSIQRLIDHIITDWETVNSPEDSIFYKRWSRLVILSDVPDPLERIFSSHEKMDEFDFELLLSRLLTIPSEEADTLIAKIPWNNVEPEYIIRLFHELEQYQEELAEHVELHDFTAPELIDLVDDLKPKALKKLIPKLEIPFSQVRFSLEDLDIIATLPHSEAAVLLRMAGSPEDCDMRHCLVEFRGGRSKTRQILFHSCSKSDFFNEIFLEAWISDPNFVKRQLKYVPAAEIGPLLLAAAGKEKISVVSETSGMELKFESKELNSCYRSLPEKKRHSAVKYFIDQA
jgi:hypothetical protein